MARAYLYLNSILYLLLALWSTIVSQKAANQLGYLTMSNRGRSEYLVIYGGLQVGLSVLFFLLARNTINFRLGLLISIGLYAPLVLYRVAIVVWKWPASGLTAGAIALEALFLIAALWLYYLNAS